MYIGVVSEVVRPQRPPAPPTEYFQLQLGGAEPDSLQPAPRARYLPQPGYVGCVRGLKIHDHVVDLSKKALQNIEQGEYLLLKYFTSLNLVLYGLKIHDHVVDRFIEHIGSTN